jgi:hypothetical protein
MSVLTLKAVSIADDASFVALADLSSIVDPDVAHRLIGGHMVTALTAHHGLGDELFRETADVDLGVAPVTIGDANLVERLEEIGYEKTSGCRFERTLHELAGLVKGDAPTPRATIDILVPTYTGHARQDRRVGDLVTTEVPGLAEAIRRPSIDVHLRMVRLDGSTRDASLRVPDEVGAFTLKSLATTVRSKPTDTVDVWRCLELLAAAGVRPASFTNDEAIAAARRARQLFDDRDARGMSDLASERSLRPAAADALHTRIVALMQRCLPAG